MAFEPETGRVWAICAACGEWNLAPIEDRWEAVEDCEGLYHAAVERAGADGVAVARTGGVELIRIGSRSGPELMTLRYSKRVRVRGRVAGVRRWIGKVGTGVGVVGGGIVGGLLMGPVGLVLGFLTMMVVFELLDVLPNPVLARVPLGDGQWVDLKRREMRGVRLVPEDDGKWVLRLLPGVELRTTAAMEAARYILPVLNRSGIEIDDLRKARNYVRKKGRTAMRVFSAASLRRGRQRTARLVALDPHIRLALEIVASEESERRALSAGFHQLRESWKNANDLAVIQDGFSYGPGIARRLGELRG